MFSYDSFSIKSAAEYFGFAWIKQIGKGSNGRAFESNTGIVMKETRNASEYEAALALKNHDYPFVVTMYDFYVPPLEVSDYFASMQYYYYTMEKLEVLDLENFYEKGNQKRQEVDLKLEYIKRKLPKKYQGDISYRNLGYKNNILKVFDLMEIK